MKTAKRAPLSRDNKLAKFAGVATGKAKRAPRRVYAVGEATQFSRFSATNMQVVIEALAQRDREGCMCMPYEDVFTYGRWQAQACQVRKGEKSIRITTYLPVERTAKAADGDAEETKTYTRPSTAFLFCRCQVDEV